MAKKETVPANTNINTNVNNNTNNVHVHVPSSPKEEKPNWIVRAIVIGIIGLVLSLIGYYIKHSTAANGKPAYIQGGAPAITRDKE